MPRSFSSFYRQGNGGLKQLKSIHPLICNQINAPGSARLWSYNGEWDRHGLPCSNCFQPGKQETISELHETEGKQNMPPPNVPFDIRSVSS